VLTATVPRARHARDVLGRYDAYSVGKGHKQASAASREAARDLARQFSRFGYEPSTDQIQTGPYQMCVTDAVAHARQLTAAVHAAVQAYDATSGAHHPAGEVDHGD
jgi:hypothetical protein